MVEAVWNEGQNFRTEGKKLDKFSTFAGIARKREVRAWNGLVATGAGGSRKKPRAQCGSPRDAGLIPEKSFAGA